MGKRLEDKLHVVTAITNPMRWNSRYDLFEEFAKRTEKHNVELWVIEAAFGDRPWAITKPDNPRHIQLRTKHELWQKENLLNLAINRLPQDWEYVAWLDADIMFHRDDWAGETVHQLQHYDFVQMFSHALDVGPQFEPLQQHLGFAYCYWNDVPDISAAGANNSSYYGGHSGYTWHPGYAWAARRSALSKVGGLIDYAILGAGDHHMAKALIGRLAESIHPGMHGQYVDDLLFWQQEAERNIRHNVGYVPGTITHYWHGKKKDRRYWDRWQILVQNGFNPRRDIKRDSQGLYQLVDHYDRRSIKLRDEIRRYFRQRNEDTIEVD